MSLVYLLSLYGGSAHALRRSKLSLDGDGMDGM